MIDFVETMDQKTDLPSCGELLKQLMAKQNERQGTKQLPSMVRSYRGASHQVEPTVQYFKAGQTYITRETRVVTKETKRKPLEIARTYTADLVMKTIKSCINSKAFGPDKLITFHLKHLGPRAIEYITPLFNLSVTTCQIPAI